MTDPIDPGLQEALKNVKELPDEVEHEKRFQKLQEVSNLIMKAASTLASELKVFQPAEAASAFDRANLGWNGGVWLLHSTIPTIQVKPTFTAKIQDDNVHLSATDNDVETVLFTLPIADVAQPAVNDAVKKYFEPKLTAAVEDHNKTIG